MNPWFVTGFTDAEGCFNLSIYKSSQLKLGWQVILKFIIKLHIKDLDLLQMFKFYFGVGNIVTSDSMATFIVYSIKDLAIIVKHFKKFNLKSQKCAHFLLFEKGQNPRKKALGKLWFRKVGGYQSLNESWTISSLAKCFSKYQSSQKSECGYWKN